jgi:hypothetical protein
MRTGSVLMNSPAILSTPATCRGRTSRVTPKTTSHSPL